jgi:helix-turn-helix protein
MDLLNDNKAMLSIMKNLQDLNEKEIEKDLHNSIMEMQILFKLKLYA